MHLVDGLISLSTTAGAAGGAAAERRVGETPADVDSRVSYALSQRVIRDDEFEAILLTVRDAAQLLAIGRTSVYQLIADGELEVIHIGRAARIPATAVHAFVRRRREGNTTSAMLRR